MKNGVLLNGCAEHSGLKLSIAVSAALTAAAYAIFAGAFGGEMLSMSSYLVQLAVMTVLAVLGVVICRRVYPANKTAACIELGVIGIVSIVVVSLLRSRSIMYIAEHLTPVLWPLICWLLVKFICTITETRGHIAGFGLYTALILLVIFLAEEVIFGHPYIAADVIAEMYMYGVALIAYFVCAFGSIGRKPSSGEATFIIGVSVLAVIAWLRLQGRLVEIRESLVYSFSDVNFEGDLENWLAHRICMIKSSLSGDLSAVNMNYMPSLINRCPVAWLSSVGGWWVWCVIAVLSILTAVLTAVYAFKTGSTLVRVAGLSLVFRILIGLAANLLLAFSTAVCLPLVATAYDVILFAVLIFGCDSTRERKCC